MTGKERAEFRSQANLLVPIFQIGKGGVTDAVVQQLESVFKTRELVKLRVHLETSPDKPDRVAEVLAERTGCEVIQVIGGVVVVYRYNEELHKPKPKRTKAAAIPPSKRRSISNRAKLYGGKNKKQNRD